MRRTYRFSGLSGARLSRLLGAVQTLRPTKALQDHLTVFSACTPLSVLARRSCTTRHAGCQGHHTLQEQGREEWLQQLQRHLPFQRHWQSLCKSHLDPTVEAGRTCLSWITVWPPSWKVNNRHGLLPSPTLGEVQRTTDAPVYRFHWPHKGVWSCQQRRSLPDPPKDWLPTKIAEHDLNPSTQTWKGQCSSTAAPPGPLTSTAASNKGAS